MKKLLERAHATMESRLWLLAIVLIMVVGQVEANRQVSQFKDQVDIYHVQAVQVRRVQVALAKENHRLLLDICRFNKIIAKRTSTSAPRC